MKRQGQIRSTVRIAVLYPTNHPQLSVKVLTRTTIAVCSCELMPTLVESLMGGDSMATFNDLSLCFEHSQHPLSIGPEEARRTETAKYVQ